MMEIDLIPQAVYVVAVSGGVDSVVLLDMLLKASSNSSFVVAHVDHGIRSNSDKDAAFVSQLAQSKQLPFFSTKLKLGSQASEALARKHRYLFLNQVVDQTQAQAIICAHHLDDFLETVILNFHRGCHRRGLVSLRSRPGLLRPLLKLSKQDILDYARNHQLQWREDASNYDLSYLRNYIRHKIMPKITSQQRQDLIDLCQRLNLANQELDQFLDNYLHYQSYRRQGKVFQRQWFNSLDEAQACEIVATWLFKAQISTNRARIKYVVVKLKTLTSGKTIIIDPKRQIRLTKRSIRLEF